MLKKKYHLSFHVHCKVILVKNRFKYIMIGNFDIFRSNAAQRNRPKINMSIV